MSDSLTVSFPFPWTESNAGYSAAGEHVDLLFAEIIEYEIAQLHGLIGLLKSREMMQQNIIKMQKKLQGLRSLPADKQDKNR